MTKRYCDRCKREMQPSDHKRLKITDRGMTLEVMYARDGVWNAGDYCHECQLEVLQALDTYEQVSMNRTTEVTTEVELTDG